MKWVQTLLLGILHGYRLGISPLKNVLFGPVGRCRYVPTCSAYAIEAIERHGAARGLFLAGHRLCRCHPWGGCGIDPVPDRPPRMKPRDQVLDLVFQRDSRKLPH